MTREQHVTTLRGITPAHVDQLMVLFKTIAPKEIAERWEKTIRDMRREKENEYHIFQSLCAYVIDGVSFGNWE